MKGRIQCVTRETVTKYDQMEALESPALQTRFLTPHKCLKCLLTNLCILLDILVWVDRWNFIRLWPKKSWWRFFSLSFSTSFSSWQFRWLKHPSCGPLWSLSCLSLSGQSWSPQVIQRGSSRSMWRKKRRQKTTGQLQWRLLSTSASTNTGDANHQCWPC